MIFKTETAVKRDAENFVLRYLDKRGYRSLLRSLFEEAGLFRKNIQYSEFPEEHAV